ncbi:MAG TPA: hypothetical protein DCZ94_04810 [Lentisphaeria bacterium]|nr:MAG: hypothetical protein A2X48_19965 [Lentisphaerae bacterium GWF2_49_21]HBC86257.1 hypothetical protein [Lentisphaeria bacterium]
MSLIVTIFVREGIIMAGDSRVPAVVKQSGPNQTLPLGATEIDGNYNVFLTQNNVGISTYGAGEINNVAIGTYIESFINHEANQKSLGLEQTADEIIKFFQKFKSPQNISFHVSGYVKANETLEQHVWEVSVAEGRKRKLNEVAPLGISWGGESDIIERLLQPLYDVDPDGNATEMPNYKIPWAHISFQDAVDFANFAITATVNAMKFQPRPKTVGGPIDILTIKPDGCAWIQRKETLLSQMNKEGFVPGKARKVIDLKK